MRNAGRATVAVAAALALVAGACSEDKPQGPALPGVDFDNPGVIAGNSSGGGAAGQGLGDGTCANGQVRAQRVAPRVILVLDGSCSMSTNYPANGTDSASQCTDNPNGRWAALRRALIDPQNGVVSKLESVVEFGVVVFGTQPNCPIPGSPVKPALNNLTMIQSRMPSVQPGMFTPTGPALDWVYTNLIEPMGPDSDGAPQIVILATDGEPNSCGGGGRSGGMVMTNYQPSLDAVKKGTMLGATTYVISLADSSGPFHDHLQQLANLGDPSKKGAATLYEPTSPQQLESNLQSLVGAAVGCDVSLNGAVNPDEACSGTVKLDGAELKCNDPNGWVLTDEHHIRVQGSACAKLMAKTDAYVEATFDCTVFRPD